MADIYKIEFEHVKTSELRRYYNADPALYKDARPVVTAEQVAEEHWVREERMDVEASIREQRDGLKQLIERGDLIRNVRMYRAPQFEPEWEEAT